jgi:hypothetical protein
MIPKGTNQKPNGKKKMTTTRTQKKEPQQAAGNAAKRGKEAAENAEMWAETVLDSTAQRYAAWARMDAELAEKLEKEGKTAAANRAAANAENDAEKAKAATFAAIAAENKAMGWGETTNDENGNDQDTPNDENERWNDDGEGSRAREERQAAWTLDDLD